MHYFSGILAGHLFGCSCAHQVEVHIHPHSHTELQCHPEHLCSIAYIHHFYSDTLSPLQITQVVPNNQQYPHEKHIDSLQSQLEYVY